jgi:hypothetical protein
MLRKLSSAIFLLTACVIALGALGHASQWGRHVSAAVSGVDPQVIELLKLIWYWVSGTMLVFGVLLIWVWWRIRQGDSNLFFIPWVVGAFYLVEGTYGALYLGTFFALFMVLAVLLCASTLGLQRAR